MYLAAFASISGLVAITSATSIREAASQNPCDGGRSFCGWFNEDNKQPPGCVCPTGQSWNSQTRACECPPILEPVVGSGQTAICASGPQTYCAYDQSNELCWDNGENVVVVVDVNVEVNVLEQVISGACSQPICPYGQTWSDSDQSCHFPCFPEGPVDTCKERGWTPICASSPQEYCNYDSSNALCEDNGVNAFQCVKPQVSTESSIITLLSSVFAPVSTSISVLGLGCLRDSTACSLTSNSWGSLCGCDASTTSSSITGIIGGVLGDVTSAICGLLDSVLQVC